MSEKSIVLSFWSFSKKTKESLSYISHSERSECAVEESFTHACHSSTSEESHINLSFWSFSKKTIESLIYVSHSERSECAVEESL